MRKENESSDRVQQMSVAGIVASVALVSSVGAQTAESTGEAAVNPVEEIVVTGTLLERDGFKAPTPTVVVGAEALAAAAPGNIANFINELPQLGSPTSPATNGSNVSSGNGGANFLNLRGLSPNRTLVLLDGRRVVSAATIGAVDVNLLPTQLVERVEIVTGGASATYGSDAVGGVVNFILDKDFVGIKADAQAGVSTHGDNEEWKAALTYGTAFSDDRGRFTISGEYSDSKGVSSVANRPWYSAARLLPNPAFVPGGDEPANLIYQNVGLSNMTDGGVITAGPLRGIQFGPNGQLMPFQLGDTIRNPLMHGGTFFDIGNRQQLVVPLNQQKLFMRSGFDFTARVSGYIEGSYGETETTFWTVPYFRQNNITISRDNAFLPPDLADQMDTLGVSSFVMGRTNYDFGAAGGHNIRRQHRGVIGVDADLGGFGKWQAYYQYGSSRVLNEAINNPLVASYNRAINSVRNPAVGGVAGILVGAPVCQSTLSNPGDGCVPLNPFGFGSPSAESIDYIVGSGWQRTELTQNVVSITGQFEPLSTWAGVVSLAVGAAYRDEEYRTVTDAVSASAVAPFWIGNYKPGGGKYNVSEQFVEVITPLLSGLKFAEQLDLSLAARYTDYSTSGAVTTWKMGVNHDVNSAFRIRATRSRDIRAPNLHELFLGGQTATANVQNVIVPPYVATTLVPVVTGGNPDLEPEVADSLGAGFVYTPRWLPGFSFSLDYFDVSIDNAITTLGHQSIVNQCYGYGTPQVPALCRYVELASPGTLAGATIHNVYLNSQSLETSGYDLEMLYRFSLSGLHDSLPGEMSLRLFGTYTRELESIIGNAVTNNLGVDVLEWRWNLSANYQLGNGSTSLTARYLGPAVYNNYPAGNPNSVQNNRIGSSINYDLSYRHAFQSGAGVDGQLYVVVHNVFDADPPLVAGNVPASYGASNLFWDLTGRTFRVGFKFEY